MTENKQLYEMQGQNSQIKSSLSELAIVAGLALHAQSLGIVLPSLIEAQNILMQSQKPLLFDIGESLTIGGTGGHIQVPNKDEWSVDTLAPSDQLHILQTRQTELHRLKKTKLRNGDNDVELMRQLDWVIHRNRRQLELLNRDPEIQGSGADQYKEENRRDHIW